MTIPKPELHYEIQREVKELEMPEEKFMDIQSTNAHDQEQANLTRIYKSLVPDEVIEKYGEQDHYYTSFTVEAEGFLAVSKPTSPQFETKTNEQGEERSYTIRNSTFSTSVLKRYYNSLIHSHFKEKGFLVKPNFVSDTEVWLPSANGTMPVATAAADPEDDPPGVRL